MSTICGCYKAGPCWWAQEQTGTVICSYYCKAGQNSWNVKLSHTTSMQSWYIGTWWYSWLRHSQVDYHNTTDFCEAIGAKLFETSSKENEGIEELFATIAEDYVADGKRDPSILVEGETRIGGRGASGGKLPGGKKKPCCASSWFAASGMLILAGSNKS